jgi:hypothetical protein
MNLTTATPNHKHPSLDSSMQQNQGSSFSAIRFNAAQTLRAGAIGPPGELVTPVSSSLHFFVPRMFPARVAKF